MSDIRALMNPSLGIQEVLAPDAREVHLPRARPLATDAASGNRLADLYRADSLHTRMLALLQPVIGDEALLRPDVLKKNLLAGRDRLARHRDPRVRRFLREDLTPLLENGYLLQEYVNMLVAG
jgi:hypothetical protein